MEQEESKNIKLETNETLGDAEESAKPEVEGHSNAHDPQVPSNEATKKPSVLVDQEENKSKSTLDVSFVKGLHQKAKDEIQKVIVGNDVLLELTLAGMLTGGHILLEGVPGVAKTLTARLIAQCMGIGFQRIQFTPDLMPSDVIGTSVFNMQTSAFTFNKGPVFSNLILIDEINRSPAKTQAALFEVMEERQVTADGTTYEMEPPFFVVATQNPIEHEGTYRLPEAQLDRFTFKLKVGYPTIEEELKILERFEGDFDRKVMESVKMVISPADISKCLKIVEQVHVKRELMEYITKIVHQTRNNGELYLGASPRASLAIMKTSKGIAALRGRDFVTPDDIQSVCTPVLIHRITLSPEKEMAGGTAEEVINDIIKSIEVPR